MASFQDFWDKRIRASILCVPAQAKRSGSRLLETEMINSCDPRPRDSIIRNTHILGEILGDVNASKRSSSSGISAYMVSKVCWK